MKRDSVAELYYLAKSTLKVCVSQNRFYIRKENHWEKVTEGKLKLLICKLFGENRMAHLASCDLKETLQRLKNTPSLQKQFTEDVTERYINLLNGVFDTERGKLTQEDEHLDFSYVLNFAYTVNAKLEDAKHFQKFVSSAFSEEVEKKMELLLQIIGYCLSEYTKAKAAFFFIGASNSGKSTILELLKRIFPEQSVSAIPLNRLENRFNIASLDGKKINICTELSEKSLSALDVFKQLTANEMVTAEHKGQAPFEFRLRCKSINAGNMLPNINQLEGMDAVLNRMVILLFPNSIPKEKQDLQLIDKLFEERDVICSLALDSFMKLKNNNFIFTEPSDTANLKMQLRSRSRVFEDFLEDMCVKGKDAQIHISTLYKAFIQYCEDNLIDVKITQNQFRQRLAGKPEFKIEKFRIHGSKPLSGVRGLELKMEYLCDKDQDSDLSDALTKKKN